MLKKDTLFQTIFNDFFLGKASRYSPTRFVSSDYKRRLRLPYSRVSMSDLSANFWETDTLFQTKKCLLIYPVPDQNA